MLADAAEPLKDVVSRVAGGRQVGGSGSLLLLGPPGVGTYSHIVERARLCTCAAAELFADMFAVINC